jgi:hypothetical protein
MASNENAKNWFHDRSLETKTDLIDAWEEGNNEQFREKAGDRSEAIQTMFENVSDKYAESDSKQVVIQELESKGFETVVARHLALAVEGVEGEIALDFRYIKRHTEINEMEKIVEKAIQMLTNSASKREFSEMHDNEKLLTKIEAIVWYFARGTQSHRREGFSELITGMERDADYSQERIDALVNPVKNNYDELRSWAHEHTVENSFEKIKEVEDEIGEIKVMIQNLSRRLTRIEKSIQSANGSPEESYGIEKGGSSDQLLSDDKGSLLNKDN